MIADVINNQGSSDASKFFLDVFQKKGYNITGKSVAITAENITVVRDRTAAGTWYIIGNSATAPTPGAFSPLFFGDVWMKTFVQAWTSGTLDKEHQKIEIDNGGALFATRLQLQTALGAVELGVRQDSKFMEDVHRDIIFNDFAQVYGVGASPVGTLRTQFSFVGYRIALV